MAADPEPPAAGAAQYISDARFHRIFTLPATADHDALTVSFADVGRAPEPSAAAPNPPTILFIPGMFSSRYLAIAMHAIAQKLGVRVLVVDRPGMGKSTDVPLPQRVPIWVELVPQLLEHLGIKHVALVSHSAGTMYLLNTLYRCRDILHPDRPSITLLAFSIWHLIPKFFLLKAGPAFASSGAIMNKVTNVVSPSVTDGGQDNSELEKNRRKMEETYGVPRELQIEIDNLVFKSMFEENTVGANSEALQCLKKGGSSWEKCEDYGIFVRELAEREKIRRGAEESAEGSAKLKVRTYFAETDAMIGKKGQAYMEECWKGKDGEFQDTLDYETSTVLGTDHDTLMQLATVLEIVFADVTMDPKFGLNLKQLMKLSRTLVFYAGILAEDVFGSDTSVFAGTSFRDNHDNQMRDPGSMDDGFFVTGNGATMIANRDTLLRAQECLYELGADWSLLEELSRDEATTHVNEVAFSLPPSVVIQLALIDLLKSWGINSSGVTGHSSGEVSATYPAGAIGLKSALAVV
ncbi:hypothetical protein G7Z17_g2907 [Cylindrodendrum hubeiense]|uniref:AB hydrolase-1 domain-containing protein n=1 Tax=Cylindrodendrum hubeiense TaxID=595255 RepID=A0A9P5HDE5_9HYPO|nr:hypothetical protein G7Z17_g2907 [Cylindrodendrum hubeiense]